MRRWSSNAVIAVAIRLWSVVLALMLWSVPASAQEPLWSFGVRGGVLAGSTDPTVVDAQTVVLLRRAAPLVSFDVIRTLDCCVELFFSGSLPRLSAGAPTASSGDGTLSPDMVQVGFNYRLHKRGEVDRLARFRPYVGLFVGGIGRGRSSVISLPATTAGASQPARTIDFRIPGGWGIGFDGGFRYRLNEQFFVDLNLKWQHLDLILGEGPASAWSPVIITGGLVVRLF